MEQDVLEKKPRTVQTRFELAAARMVESWIAAGRMRVSASDMRIAQEFLETAGWTIHSAPGARVRMVSRAGRAQEMTREAAVVIALRRLAEQG